MSRSGPSGGSGAGRRPDRRPPGPRRPSPGGCFRSRPRSRPRQPMPSGRRPLSFLSLARAGIFRHPADRLHTGWESFGQTPSHPCVGQRRPRSRPRRIPGPRRCRRGNPLRARSTAERFTSRGIKHALELPEGQNAVPVGGEGAPAGLRLLGGAGADEADPGPGTGLRRHPGSCGAPRPPRMLPPERQERMGASAAHPAPCRDGQQPLPSPRGFPGRWKGGDRLATGPALPKENADFRPGCEERHPAAGRRLVSSRPEDSIPGKPEISLENLRIIFKGKGRFSGCFQPDVAGSNRERMRASPPEIPERELTFPAISVTIKN